MNVDRYYYCINVYVAHFTCIMFLEVSIILWPPGEDHVSQENSLLSALWWWIYGELIQEGLQRVYLGKVGGVFPQHIIHSDISAYMVFTGQEGYVKL